MPITENLRVAALSRLITPRQLKERTPASPAALRSVITGRRTIGRILRGEDPRLLVVVGPCSIHDVASAREYAGRLAALRAELGDRLELAMRVYFEKPRTIVGWKGLINDPHLNGSYDIETGLGRARELLRQVNELGLPAATEFLDPIVPQYIADLVSWAAIGARTTESQTHRQMASGLSTPVGFKNGTDGGLQIALDAMLAARQPHSFLGIDEDGITSVVRTTGNDCGHVVLRGGKAGTNYDHESTPTAVAALETAGLPRGLMVDCSHANSAKQHLRQEEVWHSVIAQRVAGNTALIGLMVESHLLEGSQPLGDPAALRYGVSITDACLGWETTERMLRHAYRELGGGAAPVPTAQPVAA
ncbi:MAG TPA: 3-deoxy-7-phosphoheptulonate synthase [Verrucomicrobiota bacterium]|nr:3-deoxy-7-phosphoheptulonate synthase [Verrucomicrobiota bacterium]